LVRDALETAPALLARFNALVAELRRKFSEYQPRGLELGLCHGDLHGGNARICEGCIALFDFDCCGLGFRVYDLATYRWAAELRGRADVAWAPFIQAYQREQSLSDSELEAIPTFVALRHLWLMGVNAKNALLLGTGLQTEQYFSENFDFIARLTVALR
jgi:Ser/Thr protein kinase RdoA (MazF antagonist)